MKLKEAKALFFELRNRDRIEVCEDHVIDDHSERGYSIDEVKNLVKNSTGRFQDTNEPNSKGERFYWRTKDLAGKMLGSL